ncbi:MAG: FkbM family methyltransferase [Pseudomonadota bacterium]
MEPQAFVINRDVDADRLAAFAAAAAEVGVEFVRSPALDGHDPDAPLFLYQSYLRDQWWGGDQIKPGAFACAMSHLAVWRRFLSTDNDMALVFEDDACLTVSPKRLITDARRLSEFDVIFAGNRLSAWRATVERKSDTKLISLSRVLTRMVEAGVQPGAREIPKAPGADAYLISRRGAERLIAMLETDGLIAGIDWQILGRSVDELPAEWDEAGPINAALSGPAVLECFVTSAPIAEISPETPSAIQHKTTMPLATYAEPSVQALDGEGPQLKMPAGAPIDPVSASHVEGRLYEIPALELMRRWMPQGGVFVDVGAHIGQHSAFMLRHGGAGRAIPIEFNEAACRMLEAMTEANDLSERIDLTHLRLGLDEVRGKKEAAGSSKNLSNNRLREGFVEKIRTRPGDALLREEQVDMIKIDVNGAEREVLKGLKKTLKRKRPVLAVDLTMRRAVRSLPLIERLGYQERERVVWRDAEGDRAFAVFTSDAPPRPAQEPPT